MQLKHGKTLIDMTTLQIILNLLFFICLGVEFTILSFYSKIKKGTEIGLAIMGLGLILGIIESFFL